MRRVSSPIFIARGGVILICLMRGISMKTLSIKYVVSCFAATMVIFSLAGYAMAGITGTSHDFTSGGTLDLGANYECAACHTPHNANVSTELPLAGRTPSDSTFTLYSSTTLQATMLAPAGVDLVCLSCHDGATAVDTWNTTPAKTLASGDIGFIGTSLTNQHPTSFSYGTASADTGIRTAPTSLPLFTTGATTDFVRCATCHDPHNATPTNGSFLRGNPSTFCTDCHIK